MGTALLIPFTFAMSARTAPCRRPSAGGTFGDRFRPFCSTSPRRRRRRRALTAAWPRSGGRALGYAIMCSVIGGLFSVLVMNLVSPQLAKVGLTFSQPEYFALAVAALTLIASLGGAQMARAFIAGLIGLLLATIGIDELTADERFTFGTKALMGGINFIPAIIGAFAIGEILAKAEEGKGSRRTPEYQGVDEAAEWRNCSA